MAITVIKGNIFNSTAQGLVNPVNCEGVMGAGLALECKLRYPQMFERYRQFCEGGQLVPGKLWCYRQGERCIINFPTKLRWKEPARLSYLEQGLQKLVSYWPQMQLTSIAFPLLGTDKGGLGVETVLGLMTRYLQPLAGQVEIEIYQHCPHTPDDQFAQFYQRLQSMGCEALAMQSGIARRRLETMLQAMAQGEVCQLNQLAGLPGIGAITLEKLFRFCCAPEPAAVQNQLDF